MEIAFWLANLAVLPFWVLMIFAPHWSQTRRIIPSPYIVLPVLVVTVVWGFYVWFSHPPEGGLIGLLGNFLSPTGITGLMGVPELAMVVWVHLLVFDLFAGRWIYLDSRERDYNVWWVSPLLLLTANAAPFGFLIYLLVRRMRGMQVTKAAAQTAKAL